MKSQPSAAMENGFTAQLIKSVTPIPRQCSRTCPRAVKSIFTSIGMIMSQMRTATGRLTCAISAAPIAWKMFGRKCPSTTPATIQSATQSVKNRSNTDMARGLLLTRWGARGGVRFAHAALAIWGRTTYGTAEAAFGGGLADCVEQIGKRRQALWIERVTNPRPGDFAGNDSGRLEDAEMLGDGRLREPDFIDDVAADARLLLEKQAHDMNASGVGQCLSNCRYPCLGRFARRGWGGRRRRSWRRTKGRGHEFTLIGIRR